MVKVTRQPFDPGPAAWNELIADKPVYAPLEESETVDVAIIGAGFAGLSAALRLQQLQPNARIAVVEARSVAEGPAGRNSGFMIDLPHNLASKDYAGDAGTDLQQTKMNREAIAFASDAANSFDIGQEAFCLSGKINAAASAKGVEHNVSYAKHLKSLNESHELLGPSEMKDICGSSYYKSGLFTPGTAMLQPALYIHHLAKGVSDCGVQVFENSPVIELAKPSSDWIVKTTKGSLNANKVILATNSHVESFGHFKKRLMHIYLYASMTSALSPSELKALGGQSKWAFTPADPMGTTVRKISGTGGDRIIIRNRFTWSPDKTVSEGKLSAIGKVHDRSFANRFPQLPTTAMDYRWGGLLCLSLNTVPAFGELEPGLYSACCQNGLGTAMGTLSGKLIAELICNQQSESLRAMLSYDQPKRLPPEPFSSLGANAYMRWGEYKAGQEL